jgi:sugar lactone lactonase YvrE
MSRRTLPYLMLVSLLGVLACGSEPKPPYSLEGFNLPGETFYPEGIAVASDGTFYVGSLSNGQVVRLPAGKETVEEFSPPGVIATAAGLLVDENLGLLWVCDSSLNQGKTAIVGLALAGGAVRVRHAFAGTSTLCNDLALDAAGNLYATDSFSPRILRVAADRKLVQDSAVEWATHAPWAVQPGQFGLNGIAVKGSDLYVAQTQNNAVYRVPIAAGGAAGAVTPLTLNRTPNGLDGMKLAEDGNLIYVEGYANSLTHIALGAGDTGTLRVLTDVLNGPTTFALFAGSAWVAEGQLSKFFNPSAGSPTLPFRVRRVQLEAGLARP